MTHTHCAVKGAHTCIRLKVNMSNLDSKACVPPAYLAPCKLTAMFDTLPWLLQLRNRDLLSLLLLLRSLMPTGTICLA